MSFAELFGGILAINQRDHSEVTVIFTSHSSTALPKTRLSLFVACKQPDDAGVTKGKICDEAE